jgi:hypothetical protein
MACDFAVTPAPNRAIERILRVLLVGMLAVAPGALAAESSVEREFLAQQKTMTCVEGPTDEPSCSGAAMDVYLRGDQIQQLDWTLEMSNKFVRQQFYFRGAQSVLVVETIHAKLDDQANRLKSPKLLSTTRYSLSSAKPEKRRKELLEHAEFLIRYFREHRSDFRPCGHSNP